METEDGRMNRKLLLWNAVYMSVYLVGGTLYYLFADTQELYENHPVFAAIYVILVVAHAVLVALAVLCEWWGVLAVRRGPVILATVFCIFAAIELALMLVPLAVLLVAVILNAIGTASRQTSR
jgi:hypothetical protein